MSVKERKRSEMSLSRSMVEGSGSNVAGGAGTTATSEFMLDIKIKSVEKTLVPLMKQVRKVMKTENKQAQ